MKFIFITILLSLVHCASAQNIDSVAIIEVDSLLKVSIEHTMNRDFKTALLSNDSAELLAATKFGPKSKTYATCLLNRGRIYHYSGNFKKALESYLASRYIYEIYLEIEDEDYTKLLNNIAIIYLKIGQTEVVVPLYEKAMSISEKILGPDHPQFALIINNVALTYDKLGWLEAAEPLYHQAIKIIKNAHGTEHPDYALIINNLGRLYVITGDYEKAELYLEEAQTLRKINFGINHPEYARSLLSIGSLYRKMGQINKAETLYMQALSILGNHIGKHHPDYTKAASSLAAHYYNTSQYEKAESLYLDVKANQEITLGKANSEYAITLNNLALIYFETCQYDKSEPFFLEAKVIIEEVLGTEHRHYAALLNGLALLYRETGQYEKSEALHLRAKSIYLQNFGDVHREYVSSLKHLAQLYWITDRHDEAASCFREYHTQNIDLLTKVKNHLSQNELFNYIGHSIENQELILSFRHSTGYDDLNGLCYDIALHYKGLLLQSAGQFKRMIRKDEHAISRYHQYIGNQRQLASIYSQPIRLRDSALANQLKIKVNDIEKELSRTISGWREADKTVQWQEVQKALHPEEAAIEFVHYHNLHPADQKVKYYAALLILKDCEKPIFIPLFEESTLQEFVDDHLERKSDYVNHLYAWQDRGIIKLGSERPSLYELIWSKIEEKGLEGITTIYYASSGILHKINLGAMAINEESILSDRYHLISMNSTRQLATSSTSTIPLKTSFLMGGVHYDLDTAVFHQVTAIERATQTSIPTWEASGSVVSRWPYLKWTEDEVDRIGNSLKMNGIRTLQYTGSGASEEVFKALGQDEPSPQIIHIATHGFFFPDPPPSPDDLLGEQPAFVWSDNPMIRSGLILAGANYAWQHGHAPGPEREDGILTAYEISQMDLSHTELVVLSACETGLGDIQGNEGVYGLQRAFKIAGAKYLIMSLWQVPDRETMEFMTAFYKNWLPSDAGALAGKKEKMTIPDAFRKTQREMRDRFLNPYSWAAFVLLE